MTETYEIHLRSPTTATINLAAFYNSVKLDAAKRIGLFDGGLIAFVETTADYNVNPANKDEDDNLIPRPTNTRPVLPAGANAAAITIFNIHVVDYQALAASLLTISDKIFSGVSPATQTVMNDHAGIHPDFFLKPFAMMDFLFVRHGTINADHVLESKRLLKIPFDNVANSLESHRVTMNQQFAFLHRARHSVNDGDMMDLYEASVSAHPHIMAAIRLYKNATLFADRTFATMATFVEVHSPDQIQTSFDFGYANNFATLQQLKTKDKRPSNHRNVNSSNSTSTRHYCHVHGYASHKGEDCRFMLADPTKYTTAHLHAGSHTTPPGGSDRNL